MQTHPSLSERNAKKSSYKFIISENLLLSPRSFPAFVDRLSMARSSMPDIDQRNASLCSSVDGHERSRWAREVRLRVSSAYVRWFCAVRPVKTNWASPYRLITIDSASIISLNDQRRRFYPGARKRMIRGALQTENDGLELNLVHSGLPRPWLWEYVLGVLPNMLASRRPLSRCPQLYTCVMGYVGSCNPVTPASHRVIQEDC